MKTCKWCKGEMTLADTEDGVALYHCEWEDCPYLEAEGEVWEQEVVEDDDGGRADYDYETAREARWA